MTVLPLRSLRPYSSFYYPVLDPPTPNRGYKLNLYNQLLASEIMIYEIFKPHDMVPYSIIIEPFEDHLHFFHTFWNMDEFDTSAADHHFMMRAWHHLCPHRGAWNPRLYELSLEEEQEPRFVRTTAQILIIELFTDPANAIETEEWIMNESPIPEPDSSPEENGIKEYIGRFCMVDIICLSLVF